MAEQVALIRHGDIGKEYAGRYIGSTDLLLSPEGLRQAERLAQTMRANSSARCLCSPMARVRETARTATKPTGLRIDYTPDLREIDFGDWEGLTFDEIQARDPDRVSALADRYPDFAFPGGESIASFLERVRDAGERIAADEAHTVLVFTHGGVIRALICHYLGLDPRHYLLFEAKPASVTTVRLFGGRGILMGLNDCCHLEEK